MKLSFLLFLTSCLLFVTGCKSFDERHDESCRRYEVLHNGGKDEIEAEAIIEARSDLARGNPRIYYISDGGGFGGPPRVADYRAVAIPVESLFLIRDLPKIQWQGRGGCVIFQEDLNRELFCKIYNQEILRHLLEEKH